VLRLCDALHVVLLPDMTPLEALVRDIALTALEYAAGENTVIEAQLIEHLPADPAAQRYPDDDGWSARRTRQARSWLRGWSALEAALDPAFDVKTVPAINLDAPEGLPSGASPDAVSDPVQRRAYEAALEANRLQAARYSEQITLRRLLPAFDSHAVAALVSLYRQPPRAYSELETMLDEFSIPPEQRARVLAALEAGR
jgi:hypothetical protein